MKLYAGIGSRETPTNIIGLMSDIAHHMSAEWILRSGAALGADTAFELGAANTQIWLPWLGYNGHSSRNIVTAAAIRLAQQFHPNWKACSQGVQKMHGRNMHILLGPNLNSPVERVICWTKDGGPTGGTGQAIRAAMHYGIPVHNLFNINTHSAYRARVRALA